MAAPTKPLFNPHLLARRASALDLDLSDRQQAVLDRWVATVETPAFLRENEKPHQGKFLADLFGIVLGYRQFSDDPTDFHLKAEAASTETTGGKTPDARLGDYGSARSGRTHVVIELKAPGADLDTRQSRASRLTPVEQAFGYAPKFDGCHWVLVSNFTTIRLYRTTRGEGYSYEVSVADLADEATRRQFLFVLGRVRLLGEGAGTSPVERLAEESKAEEKAITERFYLDYHETRVRLFHALLAHNPAPCMD